MVLSTHLRFFSDVAMAAIPAPAKLTLDVEQNSYTISSLPFNAHSDRISISSSFLSSYKSWTAYALSQKILKSSAAGFSAAKARTTESENVIPVGLEYLGTHQIPFIVSSSSTYFFTSSISGPSLFIGIVIISMPNCSVMAKCLS